MESHYRQKEQKLKWQICQDFIMAEVEARYMCRNENDDAPHPWEYYPVLFSDEKAGYEKKKEEEDLEAYKEKRRWYVEEHNKRRRQGM